MPRIHLERSRFRHIITALSVVALVTALSPARGLEPLDSEPVPVQAAEPSGVDPPWIDYASRPEDGGVRESDLLGFVGDQALNPIQPGLVSGQAFRRSFRVRVGNVLFLLAASPATGTVVGVHFSGSVKTNQDAMDAAEARFSLIDLERGISWSVTGEDLGWSGQGTFGPTQTDVTHLFDGSLELETDGFYFWESLNQSPGVGCVGCTASYDGDFVVTIEYPSPVALKASFATAGPDSNGIAPRSAEYSYMPFPTFIADYVYDESFGYWSEQPTLPCFDGDVNPTNFRLALFNLTGKPVQACTFQASWDGGQHSCSQAILDVLNHPRNDRSLLIRTEDFIYVPDPACQEFSPTTAHALPGVLHWMWIEFIIDGVAYERRMYFMKE
ncbi:MAG: hypothetical protein K0U98_28355 [Deltaproteobacteria bacterium]|nr:hypothetical protein [Deltaproteobacteria bacterium]